MPSELAATEVAGECALPRMLRPFSQGARPNDTAASQSLVTCRLMQINQRLDRAGHTSVGTQNLRLATERPLACVRKM